MSEDKPLNVRVAEALGWTEIHLEEHGGDGGTPAWFGTRPADDHVYAVADGLVRWFGVPRFDKSWRTTGPLIERYRITVLRRAGVAPGTPYAWVAYSGFDFVGGSIASQSIDSVWDAEEDGETALVAVCNLIVALSNAGELEDFR